MTHAPMLLGIKPWRNNFFCKYLLSFRREELNKLFFFSCFYLASTFKTQKKLPGSWRRESRKRKQSGTHGLILKKQTNKKKTTKLFAKTEKEEKRKTVMTITYIYKTRYVQCSSLLLDDHCPGSPQTAAAPLASSLLQSHVVEHVATWTHQSCWGFEVPLG